MSGQYNSGQGGGAHMVLHETDSGGVARGPPKHCTLHQILMISTCGGSVVREGRAERAAPGAVFSAGSITWPTSLLIDPVVAGVTRNVLTRFAGL